MKSPKIIALVDMMSFFASVEQLDFPELAGRPIAVLNGSQGSTIITASYQARDYGIKTGMKLKEAQKLCPSLIPRASRPHRYVDVSKKIMAAVEAKITDEIEVFSIDECFLDLTSILHLYPSLEALAASIRKTVHQASGGLPCSIGMCEGKLTAKFAAKSNKGGTTIISADKIKDIMAPYPVDDLCGIGRKTTQFLNAQGVYTIADLAERPMSLLAKRFGNIGKRLYLTANGHDPEPLATERDPQSMGHGKILPPATTDGKLIRATLHHQCEKLARRLRENNLQSRRFSIGLRTQYGWIGEPLKTVNPTDSSQKIWALALAILKLWQGEAIYQVQITALDLSSSQNTQFDLFTETAPSNAVDDVKDAINERFGSKSIMPADTLLSADKISVIAPSWQPNGVKQSILK